MLPPVPAELRYLLDWLMDAGPALPGMSGPVPLTWVELQAWATLTGVPLRPWEAQTLRRLSSEYASTLITAEAPDCPAPAEEHEQLDADALTARRAHVDAQIKHFFGGLKSAAKR